MAKKFSYKDKISEVEKILSRLRSEDIDDVDGLISDVKSANEILLECRKRLQGVKSELDKAINDDPDNK